MQMGATATMITTLTRTNTRATGSRIPTRGQTSLAWASRVLLPSQRFRPSSSRTAAAATRRSLEMYHSIRLCPSPSRVPRSMLPCRDQMRVTTSPSLSMLTRSQACGYPLHLLLSPLTSDHCVFYLFFRLGPCVVPSHRLFDACVGHVKGSPFPITHGIGCPPHCLTLHRRHHRPAKHAAKSE